MPDLDRCGAPGDLLPDQRLPAPGIGSAELEDVETELADELTEIDARWRAAAAEVTTMSIGLEKTDVKVTHLALAWIPAP